MKKQLLLLVMILLPMVASAYPVEINGIYYNLITEGNIAEVTSNPQNSYPGDIVIPPSVTYQGLDYSVTSIGNGAFYDCSRLTSITIPNSVTSIGDFAFYDCSRLTSITIPNSVTSIGKYAFYSCSKLASVHISSIEAWCNISFSDPYANPMCYFGHLYLVEEEIKDLVIPNSVTSIGDYAFRGCSGLTSVTIPNSVTSIGNWAFVDCYKLTSVHISSIEAWCKISFSDEGANPLLYAKHLYLVGEEIKDLVIPNSVTSIGDYAFRGCSGLTSVTIPNSVTSIGKYAFYGCSGLTSVTIGNGIKEVNNWAFAYCTNLTDVYCYAESVPTTDSNAFSDSPVENATLHVPASAVDAYKAATPWSNFKEIVALTNDDPQPTGIVEINGIYYKLITNGNIAEVTSNPEKYSGDIVIPPSISYQGLDYSVTSIGNGAFYDCSRLTSITIPNSVTSIGDSAFSGCSGLTSVTIPNSVTSIGNGAFEGCSGLTSVTIPNSVTSIGKYAFGRCSGLTSVTIGNGVTSIGNGAFDGCSKLASVHISSIEAWCNISFSNSYANPMCYFGHLYLGEEEIKDLVIPNSVTSIGNYAFYQCRGLTSIIIPNSVTSIGSSAFGNCSKLSSVHISSIEAWCKISFSDEGANPLRYAKHLYLGEEEIKDLVIPNSVTSIGNYAFYQCRGLTSIIIPNSVTSIGSSAFEYCSRLTSITIPNSVTSIGSSAFEYCSGLTSVIIGNGIKEVYYKTFAYCTNLTDVYCYAESVPTTHSDAFNNSPVGNATLHVPASAVDAYKAATPWSNFKEIVALTNDDPQPMGIDKIVVTDNSKDVFYDLNGRRVDYPSKGLYIKNGKKYVVK